jgi:hypothetical protein
VVDGDVGVDALIAAAGLSDWTFVDIGAGGHVFDAGFCLRRDVDRGVTARIDGNLDGNIDRGLVGHFVRHVGRSGLFERVGSRRGVDIGRWRGAVGIELPHGVDVGSVGRETKLVGVERTAPEKSREHDATATHGRHGR